MGRFSCHRMITTLAGSAWICLLLSQPAGAQTLISEAQRHAAAETVSASPAARSSAAAQVGARSGRLYKWEVEVHGAAAVESRSSDGTRILPDPGAGFTTFFGSPSRRVSSWYLGDGTTFFNGLPSNFRNGQTITPLDSAVGTGIRRGNGGILGARVGYGITPRISAEFSFDYGFAPLEFDADTLEQIEASRASFATAWSGFAAAAMTTGIDVTSTTAIVDEQGHQLITVGAVLVKLTPERRITPFVTGGIGLIANSGDDLSATVTGRYSFVFNGSPLTENDRVTIRYALADRDVIGVVGGGITHAVTGRSGVRIDVRAHIGQNSARTTADLSPSVQAQQPFNVLATNSNPSLQFSNLPAASGGPQSTLTGSPITGFETFQGDGTARVVTFGAGWYWRF